MLPPPGSTVWIRQRRWTVERLDRHGRAARVDVVNRERHAVFVTPFDRPVADNAARRPRRVRRQAARARLLAAIARTGSHRSIDAATFARMDLLPYQLEPALAVMAGARRVLLADDVGLGKTIQAGVAIAELCRRVAGMRALILVPAAVRDQWAAELNSRFGLQVRCVDAALLRRTLAAGRAGDNPWRQSGIWLGSTDFLKQPHVLDGLPRTPFDALVIDEAHDVCGDSVRHDACAALARRARRVLLLSATPHSGDDRRFSRLVALGALQGAPDQLIVFRRRRADVAHASDRHVRWHFVRPHEGERRLLEALGRFERAVLQASRPGGGRLLLSVFRKRAISTSAALARSIERRLAWVERSAASHAAEWVQPPLAFDDRDDVGPEEAAALCSDSGLQPGAEAVRLRRLLALAVSAIPQSSKLRRLQHLLTRCDEPVVVFTEFRDSLETIAASARPRWPVATLHGGQSDETRRLELGRFLSGAARVLLATDVASQGLNLQTTCRWVVSYELPWNPARLEQRIGRVDRIGQSRVVHATLLVARHAYEDRVLLNLARRALTARRRSGADVLGDLIPPSESRVAAALLDGSDMPIERAAPAALVTAGSWRRAGRAMARMATRNRGFLRADLSSHALDRRPVYTCDSRVVFGGGDTAVALVLVTLIAASGSAIERHALAICGAARLLRVPSAVRGDLLRHMVASRLAARVRRLERIRTAERIRSAAIEQALEVSTAVGEGQFGLFDARAARQLEERLLASRSEQHALAARLARLDRDRSVTIAPPMVEIIWMASPRHSS